MHIYEKIYFKKTCANCFCSAMPAASSEAVARGNRKELLTAAEGARHRDRHSAQEAHAAGHRRRGYAYVQISTHNARISAHATRTCKHAHTHTRTHKRAHLFCLTSFLHADVIVVTYNVLTSPNYTGATNIDAFNSPRKAFKVTLFHYLHKIGAHTYEIGIYAHVCSV